MMFRHVRMVLDHNADGKHTAAGHVRSFLKPTEKEVAYFGTVCRGHAVAAEEMDRQRLKL